MAQVFILRQKKQHYFYINIFSPSAFKQISTKNAYFKMFFENLNKIFLKIEILWANETKN